VTWAALFFGLLLAAALLPFIAEIRKPPMDEAARAKAPGRFAGLSRGVTHFRWYGPPEGPVTVCVHGLATPSFVFDEIALDLAGRGHRVLVYDLYGRGYSDRPDGFQTRDFFLRQLQDLLAHEGVRRDFTLVGYSMGGAIATTYAALHMGRVRRLVLVAPAGMGGFPTGLFLWMRNLPLAGDWLIRAVYPRLHRKAALSLHRDQGVSADVAAAQAGQLDHRGFLPAVLSSLRGNLAEPMEGDHRKIGETGLPVTAIWAVQDRAVPIRCMGVLAGWNRDVRQVQIGQAGHWLPLTHPRDVVAAILDPQPITG